MIKHGLSILVPVYQYDCTMLVEALVGQCQEVSIDYEIILGDDASEDCFAKLYEALATRYQGIVQHKRYECNRGASLVRTALAHEANLSTLLYIDADVLPVAHLVARYWQAHTERPLAVVCGGFFYAKRDLRADNRLRYYYGTRVEMRSLQRRLDDPYRSFVGMCFLAPRSVLFLCPFPDMGMGYEDAYWGELLQQQGVSLCHIEAPVEHRLKESDSEFLATTRRYVSNLWVYRHDFAGMEVKLLLWFERIEQWHMVWLGAWLWDRLGRYLDQLLRRYPWGLLIFQVYKVLFLCRLGRRSSGACEFRK